MSKGLEALEKIDHTICLNEHNIKWDADKYDHCACIDINEFVECYETIEKELKALEIIKPLVDLTKEQKHCWLWLGLNGRQITQEQYDLLKEVLL